MLSDSKKSVYPNDSNPVIIQDFVVYGPTPPPNPAGEFDKPKADVSSQIDRMYSTIEGLILEAAKAHIKEVCDSTGKILSGNEDVITRLITNEFAFYTKEPLSLDEFEGLQNKIASLAKTQPLNLQLILASFAVRTPENKIMNVVAQIDCGENPAVDFIVKNYPSAIDPVYKENSGGKIITLPNVSVKNGDQVDDLSIVVHGQNKSFSFNNVNVRKTASGEKYLSCVDICLDHFKGVGKDNLDELMSDKMDNLADATPEDFIPLQGTQVVTSNCIELYSDKAFVTVSHADPHYSALGQAKQDFTDVGSSDYECASSPVELKSAITFGPPLKAMYTNASVLQTLEKDARLDADDYNAQLSQKLSTPVSSKTANALDVNKAELEKATETPPKKPPRRSMTKGYEANSDSKEQKAPPKPTRTKKPTSKISTEDAPKKPPRVKK